MQRLGLIGGSGLDRWGEAVRTHRPQSEYGEASDAVEEYRAGDLQVYFLPRHGRAHEIPPHAVNYRANIDSLRQLGVEGVLAVNAVGGIAGHCRPGALLAPEQLIDYTWGREHSFSLTQKDRLQHVEFAAPFSGPLRVALLRAAAHAALEITDGGCIAVTQGPRLETRAEILRLARDGCDMVGMTSMPEAALAREAGLDYASLCVCANRAAGLSDSPISMEAIETTLSGAMDRVRTLLGQLFMDLRNVC